MPSQLPSSFASAAAGQTRDPRASGRGESVRGSGSGEWPRSNGTRTFRRPSTTPFSQTAPANAGDPSQNPVSDALPLFANTQSSGYDPLSSLRYSKEDLLDIYKNMEPGRVDPSSLFMPTWNPNHVNGSSSRGWGKSGDTQHVPQDPTVCWDPTGGVRPVSLEEMTPEEREMFATDVNSTLKLPQQTKEGNGAGGQNGRKTSISLGSAGNYPLSSPSTASRPGTRRRETAETNPFPSASVASPTGSRFSRDEPWLPRRSTELKEPITDEPEEDINPREAPSRNQSFGLPRSSAGGVSAFGSASLWGSVTTSSAAPAAGLGAFGNFALNTSAIGDKRYGTGSSRLAHLMPKDSSENLAGKLGEAGNADVGRGWRPRQRTDTDPFAGEGSVSGSAILGGAQDNSPPTLTSQIQRGGFDTPVKGNAGDFGMTGLNIGAQGDLNGPASPSETNPYRSPADRLENGQDDNDLDRSTQSGPGSEPPSHYGTLSRTFGATAFEGSDRSQTSSVGAKGFPTVNTMTGWPGAPTTGTPDRERQAFNGAFGGSFFSPLGDLQSPSLGGLGGMFSSSSASGLGRGSKLGSLFPPAMQAQMHGQDQESLGDSVPDLRQANPLGAIGRGPIGAQPREAGSPVRAGRGAFEDLFSGSEAARSAFSTGEQPQPGLTTTSQAQSFPVSSTGPAFSAAPASADPSAVRTMVMPDRMRWVYLDPQGTMQGPFNGLEMNDWYKANFFSPDLRVKRIEDPDFEPLGQLIRRIGNSREPFLVPQMGIPHGPPPATPFTLPGSEAVPPLQNAFPSFGRTLTAAQQNDLERRKQEEQLYHARQRELAHHHQAFGRLPMQPGVPGSLHHHSSAQSLQSQPSFGSMTSPIGVPSQPPIGPLAPNSSFFDSTTSLNMAQAPTQSGIGAAPDIFNPDLNLSERQMLANMQVGGGGLGGVFPGQPAGAPGGEGSGLRSQLPGIDQLQKDSQGFSTRIKEFHDLRAQHDAEESNAAAKGLLAEARVEGPGHGAPTPTALSEAPGIEDTKVHSETMGTNKAAALAQAGLSLAERVMQTQADAAAAAAASVTKPSQQPAPSGLPMPFPPPVRSTTPIAAPTAQRPASNLPTRYDERSASGTPDTTSDGAALAPPPTAPWAPQPGTEAQKGPSLKEIQEAEAKKAAKKEEAAAAMRRAALEQEAAALRERERAAAVTIGLPASSTWGTGSPVGTPGAGSAWKQPAAAKGNAISVAPGNSASKKTLADIQREEELRKQKAREASVQTTVVTGAGMGKRYADLASKSSAPPGLGSASGPQATSGGGWSTVGAGGKVKIPTGPAAQTRATSVGNTKAPTAPAAPRAATKQNVGLKDAKGVAMEEFKKWLHKELGRGLIGVADIDHFAATLLEMPLEPLILSEAVYGYSTTMDGRHFAEEFVRRKKLADRGMFDKEPVTSSTNENKNGNNGGWSEVAKKGGSSAPKEDNNVAGFRMVASKKGKGKKQA